MPSSSPLSACRALVCCLLLLAAACCSLPAVSAKSGLVNLIQNGGFESGSFPPWQLTDASSQIGLPDKKVHDRVVRCGHRGIPCASGHYIAVFESAASGVILNQTVFGIENDQLYSFSFMAAGVTEIIEELFAYVQIDDGVQSAYNTQLLLQPADPILFPFRTFEGHFKLQGKHNAPNHLNIVFGFLQGLPHDHSSLGIWAIDDVQLVAGGHVVGDPVFSGFHQQQFRVTGVPGRVFNLLSTASLQVNSRFVSLVAGQSMSAAEMKTIRSLMEITGAATAAASSSFVPLPTTAWNHDGTYLGSVGVKLAGHRLLVDSGAYRLGFANVTLDGVDLPVSSSVVVLADGSQLHRPTPFSLTITTAAVSFTLLNADHFLNLEQVALLQPVSAVQHSEHATSQQHAHTAEDAGCGMQGLLGQTADPAWQVQKTEHWKRHLELDHLLAGDDIFGDDFSTNLFNAA